MKNFSKIQFFFGIGLLLFAATACKPDEVLPPETRLTYQNTQLYGDSTQLTALVLQVAFQDGDGNIGLEEYEVGPPFVDEYAYNFYVHVFDKKEDGSFVPMLSLSTTPEPVFFAYRFAVPKDARNPSVKGDLEVTIQDVNFSLMQSISRVGVVRFELYMYDRDLVKSNVVLTPEIRLK